MKGVSPLRTIFFSLIILLAQSGATYGGLLIEFEIASNLQQRLFQPPTEIDNDPLFSPTTVATFYRQRSYRPYWSHQGHVTPTAHSFLQHLGNVINDGLEPLDYHLLQLTKAFSSPRKDLLAEEVSRLEILLSDAFFHLAFDLQGGEAPQGATWSLPAPKRIADSTLFEALRREEPHRLLQKMRPNHPDYAALRNALNDYRQIATQGGWSQLPPKILQIQEGEGVHHLRHRLAASHDIATAEGPEHIDIDLKRAIRHFQKRHGLPPSGEIDEQTLTELNVPITERIRSILANLKRWRQMPRSDFPARYLLVNIPGYRLRLIDHGRPLLDMRVVVGRPERPTPVMQAMMTHLVLNPFWEVPTSIATEDIWPRLIGNPDYAERQGYHVVNGWDDEREIDLATLPTDTLDVAELPYRLRQAPGPANALGRIKFIFPNRDNIYLHDTPERRHFSQLRRDFSSGCIRLEEPLELADALLSKSQGLTRRHLEQRLKQGNNQKIPLSEPLAVYLLYWTAFVDHKGELQFRQDLYGVDPEPSFKRVNSLGVKRQQPLMGGNHL